VFSALSFRMVSTNTSLLLFLGAAAISALCIALVRTDHGWWCPAGFLCFVDWGIEVQAVVFWSLVDFQNSMPSAAQQKYFKYCGRARRTVADRKAVQQTAGTAPACSSGTKPRRTQQKQNFISSGTAKEQPGKPDTYTYKKKQSTRKECERRDKTEVLETGA